MPKRKRQSCTSEHLKGGVARYAKAQGLTLDEARKELQGELANSLRRPVRRRFKTSPVLVFNKDNQWQADLVDMQALKKWNGGNQVRVGRAHQEQDGSRRDGGL